MRILLVSDIEVRICTECGMDHPRVTLVGLTFTCPTTKRFVTLPSTTVIEGM